MLYLAQRLKFINEQDLKDGLSLCDEIGRILNGFINSLKR
ncbi:four helix bundle protein [Spirosoma endophyticum]|uniref:Four helix bundle protein n=2 Tax=Spirosoma endophyticum TaxID=662367 RepID=A0A1I1NCM0_9BACT|nr:four helix bundle protein [Spirosoma endophyticum]